MQEQAIQKVCLEFKKNYFFITIARHLRHSYIINLT